MTGLSIGTEPIFMLNSSISLSGTSVESLLGLWFSFSARGLERLYQARHACIIAPNGRMQLLVFNRAVDVVADMGICE